MNTERRDFYDLAATQHGLVTRADLSRLELTPRRRRSLLDQGVLQPLGRQVFRIGGAPATTRQMVLAGCLEVDGVASHHTSAWMHRIKSRGPGSPPQVTVHRARFDYRPELAQVHTTTWLPNDDIVRIDHVPCFGVARTLFSLAAITPDGQLDVVRDAVDEAIRDGKATDAWLWWRLEKLRRRGRPGVRRFESVLSERQGGRATESWLEREFLKLLAEAGLPLPVCQERISHAGAFVARVDFLYAELNLVIEVSGHAHHSTRAQTSADAARRTALVAAGYRVLEFTYDDIVRNPGRVLAVIRDLVLCRPAA